jgi:regulatory protein SWI6
MSGILQSASMQFTQESRIKQDLIDNTNEQIASLSAQQKQEQQRLDTLRSRLRARHDRAKRITNLKRFLEVQRHALAVTTGQADLRDKRRIGYADSEGAGLIIRGEELPAQLLAAGDHLIRKASDGDSYLSTPLPFDTTPLAQQNAPLLANLPSIQTLRHRLEVYIQNNGHLANRSMQLKEKDGQLEVMYRKVVSLCTKVEEEKIDDVLGNLVQALDSDPLDGVEVGRVREFLRKVEGVES